MTIAQNNTEFHGIGLRDLLAMDRVNVDAWAANFNYLNSRRMGVTMEIHEVAVNELLTGDTLPFSVSEIMEKVQQNEVYRKIAVGKNIVSPWSWKLVRQIFSAMEQAGHLRRLEQDSNKKKVKYVITAEFRQIVRNYYAQYAKTVRIVMSRMQINDSTASFTQLVADNPVLISELGLEKDDE